MAKKKSSDHVTMKIVLPEVLAAQIRQIAFWAETEPEVVIRVFLVTSLAKQASAQPTLTNP